VVCWTVKASARRCVWVCRHRQPTLANRDAGVPEWCVWASLVGPACLHLGYLALPARPLPHGFVPHLPQVQAPGATLPGCLRVPGDPRARHIHSVGPACLHLGYLALPARPLPHGFVPHLPQVQAPGATLPGGAPDSVGPVVETRLP
jgi:hypothetical protein